MLIISRFDVPFTMISECMKRLIILLCAFFVFGHAHAQIFSLTANSKALTIYPVLLETDTIYVFCDSDGSLTAHIENEPGPFDFQWSQYNSVSGLYEFYTSGSGTSHTVSGMPEGGYRVHITGGGVDEMYRAWIFNSIPIVSASIVNVLCGQIAFSGIAEAEIFNYYDPVTGQVSELTNSRTFLWSSNTGAVIPNPAGTLEPITYLPPVEDTWYLLTVTDSYGCMAQDSAFYATIETKADFEFDPSEGPSPLTVSFTNKSLNAVGFEWFFDYLTTGVDGIPEDLTENPDHIFEIPGIYIAALRTYSPQGCTDLFVANDPITVSPSSLEVPNVFTPNNDGFNDIFIVSHSSLKNFHGVILNRAGQKVFEWTDPDRGWDGKLSSGNDASPGAYYYVIRGAGWDGKKYDLKGILYLYRGR
jgi:gliding motility-associated-like protein